MQETDALLRSLQREISFDFIRASGPGGQNVNKVATAVQLRFDVRNSSLSESVKERLIALAGQRVTANGILIVEAKRRRTQEQNREDAIRRLQKLIMKAVPKPKHRKKSTPTLASKEKRLRAKKKHGEIKRTRQNKLLE